MIVTSHQSIALSGRRPEPTRCQAGFREPELWRHLSSCDVTCSGYGWSIWLGAGEDMRPASKLGRQASVTAYDHVLWKYYWHVSYSWTRWALSAMNMTASRIFTAAQIAESMLIFITFPELGIFIICSFYDVFWNLYRYRLPAPFYACQLITDWICLHFARSSSPFLGNRALFWWLSLSPTELNCLVSPIPCERPWLC